MMKGKKFVLELKTAPLFRETLKEVFGKEFQHLPCEKVGVRGKEVVVKFEGGVELPVLEELLKPVKE